MKVVILAGGLPSNISDEKIPKPMLEIGGRPLLWHIMKWYSMFGYTEFVICTGYRSELIKDYFMNYYIYSSDITVDLKTNDVTIHNNVTEPWKVSIVDTGLESTTAQRVKMIEPIVGNERFLLTYGDCISNIDISKLVASANEKSLITLALAKPTGRNSIIPINQDGIMEDVSKMGYVETESWSSAYSMVVSPEVFRYIPECTMERFEEEIIKKVAVGGKVSTYIHNGFWLPVETYRDRMELEHMWNENLLPWRE